LTEAEVTIGILEWLKSNNWEILAYDFPQSGTGLVLHPDKRVGSTKNKNSIIPDIIAAKGSIGTFFENKDRYFANDFDKVNQLRTNNLYQNSITDLLKPYNVTNIYFGIGIPNIRNHVKSSLNNTHLIDFLISYDSITKTNVIYETTQIF
jgi:hypothetical protein